MSLPFRPGERVADRYRLERQLGRGAAGVVFLATHEGLGRQVAIKFLEQRVADDPEVRARFDREGKAATSIGRHASVVEMLDVGTTENGVPFLVMEYYTHFH